jgi:hypothetical protein
MNTRHARPSAIAVVLVLLTLAAPLARAANGTPVPVKLGPGSELVIEGKSTVHDFECRSREVSVQVAREPGAAAPADAAALLELMRAGKVASVKVSVPVQSLKSEKSGLDKNLRKTMRADEHPTVTFALGSYTVKSAVADTLAIEAQGTLTITGQSRPVTLEGRAFRAAEGVWLEGSEPVRMTEYGIKPPVMMLGTLKVKDLVTVRYRLLLVLAGDAAAAPDHQ